MSERQDPRMLAPRRAYDRRGQVRRPPLRGSRGAPYQRGLTRGAFGERGSRGSYRLRGGPPSARRRPPLPPPPPPPSRTLWEIVTQLRQDVRSLEWWQAFWLRVPVRRRCAVCMTLRAGAWAAVVVSAAGGAAGVALLAARALRAQAWATVYADRAALLAYLTALATAALLLLPAAAVLLAGLALHSDALVEGYLWAVTAHLAVDWLATGFMAIHCLANPACLCGTARAACCAQGGGGGGAAAVVPGTVLMLGYSAVWVHLLITVNSYRHTF